MSSALQGTEQAGTQVKVMEPLQVSVSHVELSDTVQMRAQVRATQLQQETSGQWNLTAAHSVQTFVTAVR